MATAVHGEDGGGSAGASAEGNQGDAALVFTDPAGRGAEIIPMMFIARFNGGSTGRNKPDEWWWWEEIRAWAITLVERRIVTI